MATQVHPTWDVQHPLVSPWPSEPMIPPQALASPWFIITLISQAPHPSVLVYWLPLLHQGPCLWLHLGPPSLWRHPYPPFTGSIYVSTSSGSSVSQSTSSNMVSYPASSSEDLHPYCSAMVISSTYMVSSLTVSSIRVSSPTMVSLSAVVISSVGSDRVCFAPELQSVLFLFSFNKFSCQLHPCFNSLIACTTPWHWTQVILCLFFYLVLYNRMQNDVKLPQELRRKWVSKNSEVHTKLKQNNLSWQHMVFCSYAHALDGLLRVWREGENKQIRLQKMRHIFGLGLLDEWTVWKDTVLKYSIE